jgi:hypothetical protein
MNRLLNYMLSKDLVRMEVRTNSCTKRTQLIFAQTDDNDNNDDDEDSTFVFWNRHDLSCFFFPIIFGACSHDSH